MKGIQRTLFFILIFGTISCNRNSEHNASMVSFGGMKPHDRISLDELESNFDSPNDFILISHSGKDMDFNTNYSEGDSLITYYNYHLEDSKEELLGIVWTYKEQSKTICAPCGQDKVNEFKEIHKRSFEKNLNLTIDALDSLGLREK